MLTKGQYQEAQKRALEYMKMAGVVLSKKEKKNITVADFGLSDLKHQGGQILTFFNTDRISAKIIVLFPWQILPEHWHPAMGNDIGKEEITRVRWGEVYLYVPGETTPRPKAKIPLEERISLSGMKSSSGQEINISSHPKQSTGFRQAEMEL
jgi:D-lyxose ketol-isomerase